MPPSQDKRAIKLKSPVGDGVLHFARLSGSEHVSAVYSYEIDLVSESGTVDADTLLGQPASVSFNPGEGGKPRFIHGVVSEFSQVGFANRLHHYRAVLRPWLWFLTRTADCRMFQDRSVPQIFEAVAKEYGFSDYRLDLRGTYPNWEYCVQYRETDFNFLNRLFEQEGIYYYFDHFEDRHELVLSDEPSCHVSRAGYDKVPYFTPGDNAGQRERDHLSAWTFSKSVQPGTYALGDFDFEQPRKPLNGKATGATGHARDDFEMFDYPAELQRQESAETERIAKLRLQELHTTRLLASGQGDASGLATGFRFELEGYPRADLNIEYLVIGTHLTLSSDGYQSGGVGGEESDFSVSIEAIDASVPYRPSRVTPKPVIQGSQTAIVVGKSGEEIWTDQYGRVKVQFHWDRYGKRDENSSCWVRVAQVWAGEKWGAMHVPRIGQEVIVSFLEGDPDQPIIIGRVYNGTHKPPYDLPGNQTQSGIKSRSSKGGTAENFNEIRFEDKKGEEQLVFHAEKDLVSEVENDQSVKVGHDETRKVAMNRKSDIGQDDQLKVGKRYVLEAGDEITLKTGSSQLVMKKDGTILLKGVKIKIDGANSITEKAGQKLEAQALQVSVKGTKVEVQGTMLDLKASAIATLKGSLTKIG